MSDICIFCETRRPEGGTNHLVLGEGADQQWLEFCEPCGKEVKLKHEITGEELTVQELYDRSRESVN
jgi:hypothetical protein